MRKRIWFVLVAVIALLISTACEGATSGSVVGARQSCRTRNASGVCEGSFRKLTGSYGEDIENDMIFSGDAIQVEVEASVESGSIRVSVESPDGEVSSATVLPGQSASLTGIAEGESSQFEVRFEAIEGEAMGISYTIAYQEQ